MDYREMIIKGCSEMEDRFVPWRKYTYYFPIIPEVPMLAVNKYEGLSLQEIRERYGADEAQEVYNIVASGGSNPTKPTMPSCEPIPKILAIDWEYNDDSSDKNYYVNYSLKLLPNACSIANKELEIGDGSISSEFYQDIPNEELLREILYRFKLDNVHKIERK